MMTSRESKQTEEVQADDFLETVHLQCIMERWVFLQVDFASNSMYSKNILKANM